jgi:hypothetical protein
MDPKISGLMRFQSSEPMLIRKDRAILENRGQSVAPENSPPLT